MLKKNLNVNIDLLISKISAEKQNQEKMVDKDEIKLSELKIQEMRILLNSLMANVNELNDRVSTIENTISPIYNSVHNLNFHSTHYKKEHVDERIILSKKYNEDEVNRINDFIITCSNHNKSF